MDEVGMNIHPVVSFTVIVWVMVALYINFLVSALALPIILTAYLIASLPLEQIRRLAIMYLWVTIPPYIVLTLIYGPIEAVDIVLRLFIIASTFTSVLRLIKPIELTYTVTRLGIPTLAALTIPMVMKLADYMSYSVGETLVALKGRGLRGRKLLINLPVPLIVHAVISSAQLAESLTQKQFKNVGVLAGKSVVRISDIIIVAYVLVSIAVLLIQSL